MLFFILSGTVQLAMVVHALKTGRNTYWVWLILMVPFIGSAAYLIIELGPELTGSTSGQRATRKISHSLNPNKDLNTARMNLDRSDTYQHRLELGNALIDKQLFAEAIPHYQQALKGLNEFNPTAMVGLANAQFAEQLYSDAKDTLDTLIEKNPGYRHQDSHLLYAQVLASLGDIDGATEEYEALIQYYTGPEPHVRFAELLYGQGNTHRATELLDEVLTKAKLSPAHYTKFHSQWINLAKQRAQAQKKH